MSKTSWVPITLFIPLLGLSTACESGEDTDRTGAGDTDDTDTDDTDTDVAEHSPGDITCQDEPGDGNWKRTLEEWVSEDGTTFTYSRPFQYCSDVPSIAQSPDGTLVSTFQYFVGRDDETTWDKVAMRKSTNGGQSWSPAEPILLNEFPEGHGRPFDPTITYDTTGEQWRLFFSMSLTGQTRLDETICTYSAASEDGLHYTFEEGERYCADGRAVIDPAVTALDDTWYYIAPSGAPQDGAHFATSTDGLNFTAAAIIPSDKHHNWTGNVVAVDGSLRFYGAESLYANGNYLWWSSSADGGVTWSDFQQTDIPAGKDPGVVRLAEGTWLLHVPTKVD
jgi:hypothetical protein